MVICLTSINVIAAEGAYQVYKCPTDAAAYSCLNLCKKTNSSGDFKVNVQQSIVIVTWHLGGIAQGGALDNCKVVDQDNWYCETVIGTTYSYEYDVHRFTDGVYSFSQKKSNSGIIENSYSCAKKKSLFGIFD